MTSQNAMVLTVEFTENSSVTGQTQNLSQTYLMLPLDTGCTNSIPSYDCNSRLNRTGRKT